MVRLVFPVLLLLIAKISVLDSAAVELTHNVRLLDSNGKELELGKIEAEKTTVGELREILSFFLKSEMNSVKLIALINSTDAVELDNDQKFLSAYSKSEKDLTIEVHDTLNNPEKVQVELPRWTIEVNLTKDRKLESFTDYVSTLIGIIRNRIVFNGQKLVNNSMTLGDYKFRDGAHIIMVPDRELYTVVVRKLNGEFMKFDLTLETTVGELKKMIEAREKVNMEGKGLIHYETILDDKANVFSYTKTPSQGLIVYTVERLMRNQPTKVDLFYDFGDGNRDHTSVDVTAESIVGDLKEFAATLLGGLTNDELALEFQGKLLEDDLCKLTDLYLYENSTIRILKKN